MPVRTELMRRLRLAHPIIQAPMAGGRDTPDLVAAVCEAGGLGNRRRLSHAGADRRDRAPCARRRHGPSESIRSRRGP